jgi:flavoprotein, HI0933 family
MAETVDIVVIGGGAAGSMAAIKAAESGCRVVLLEKNPSCGRKILLTGKGRCNITNTKPWGEFSTHLHPVAAFAKPAFYNFSNEATIEFFNSAGLPTSVEQGERVFPASMRAADVAATLDRQLRLSGVDVRYQCEAAEIDKSGELMRCTYICGRNGSQMGTQAIISEAVIVATGGLSYPVTGSTGDGYRFAQSFSHTIIDTFPSLTALIPFKYDIDLFDLELKNVGLTLFVGKDQVQAEMGDMTFTSNGIEGSLGYRLSRRAVKALINGQKVSLALDLKPALSIAALENRISRELAAMGIVAANMGPVKMRGLLRKLMPEKLIKPFVADHPGLTASNLPEALKSWAFPIKSFIGYERAVVTAGGVSQKEITAKNMRSKLEPRLYFAGEVIDIDGDTGGYNLQVAFSTGALAGISAAQQILKSRIGSESSSE